MIIFTAVYFLWAAPILHAEEPDTVKVTLSSQLTTPENVSELIKLQALQSAGKTEQCLNSANAAAKTLPQVKAWLQYIKLQCAKNEYLKNKKSKSLAAQIQSVWSNPDELLFGAAARKLRVEVVSSSLLMLDEDAKVNKKQAWVFIGQLLEAKDWMNSKEKAKTYKVAGELSLAQGKLPAARDYFDKSLIEESNPAVQARLNAVAKMIDPKVEPIEPQLEDVSKIESTREELEIYDRMSIALKTGDLIAATEDAVKIIQEFPGGKRADIASREILNIYLSLADKDDGKFANLKDRVLTEMRKVDGQRQFEWAKTLYARENFFDAYTLGKNSLEKIEGQPISTQVLMLTAMSAHNFSDFNSAYKYYEIIVKQHSGTKLAAEAQFRLGLLDFRNEKYAAAGARFEKFLQLEHSDDFELSSLYWLWRSKQKISPEESVQSAEKLISRYPVSYYGLRARAELNSNKLTLPKATLIKPQWVFNFTDNEYNVWKRYLILKKANWLVEARSELSSLEEPESAEGKIIFAYLWSEVGDYYHAAEISFRAFSEDPTLVAQDSLQISYPRIYMADIKKEAKRYNIPPELVLSLMKQESSFRVDVQSPAGALGLMQLMPVTAKEVSRDMKISTKNLLNDLITPKINIRIGTQYLHRRIRYFSGHVPLALGAYNAGIGNIRGWLRTRSDLGTADKNMSSSPINEMWLEELPWPETTGYIKSILRNYMVYKFLEQGEFELAEPIWSI